MDASGGGRFREIVLRPVATIAEGDDVELALRLHELAHARCFIANSCSIPIRHEAQVRNARDARARPRSASPMFDLTIDLEDTPGALATMGEALGRAGVSIEGGGAWVAGGRGVAHFLFRDGAAARRALEDAGFRVLAERARVVSEEWSRGVPVVSAASRP